MGESKQTRLTKNSQKVSSLEDQNRILEEVLRASREAAGQKNKEKPNPSKGISGEKEGEDPPGHVGVGDKKRKADQQLQGESPSKKVRPQEGAKVPKVPPQGPKEHSEKGQILEYPDYVANREDDFDEGRSNMNMEFTAGSRHRLLDGERQKKPETVSREHVLSSEEEDDIDNLEDPYDNVNNDFLGDEAGWDNRSISSSVIFPSHSRYTGRGQKESGVRPESRRSRSEMAAPSEGNSGVVTGTKPGNENIIENLVKERAGVDANKDSVGPPIADCIADLLKSYLKDPSTEEMIKLLEKYPRPINAEWLQAPTLGTQIAASIPKRSNSYDKRLRQSQLILGGSLAAMANVLQDIMNRGKQDSSLLELARKVMDAMALSGYVHFDFNTLRKGAIRQVVNPSYAGVFTRRTSSTPESLLGECSVPDQLKEYDETNKVRAKLQKPRKTGGNDTRHENSRGRGRGNFGNRGGFPNRQAGNNQGSGFGNYNNVNSFQRGGRGSRPNYPHQRRVYGQNNQEQGHRDQKNN